jgi:hypothetical protein
MQFNLIVPLIVGAIWLLLFFILNRWFQLADEWIKIIKKVTPLWLVFFPACITYFIVCGSISAGVNSYLDVPDNIKLMTLHNVEYFCSFVMPFLYFLLLEKYNFNKTWGIIITIVHMLFAGYRDAKWNVHEVVDSVTHITVKTVETGPKILDTFQYSDAIFPMLSFFTFYYLLPGIKKLQNPEEIPSVKS